MPGYRCCQKTGILPILNTKDG